SLVVTNLAICDETPFAFSISWNPIIEVSTPTTYQVRYAKSHTEVWSDPIEKDDYVLRCPGSTCDKHCFLIFNLDGTLSSYMIQVRLKSGNVWNRWRTMLYVPSAAVRNPRPYDECCIVSPPYFVDFIGHSDTIWKIPLKPVPNDTYVNRYFVIVDERETPGAIDERSLFDKVTAKRRGIPYYIAAALDRRTLYQHDGQTFIIGDGQVHGGYLNYPLVKGKKYNWAFMTSWDIEGKPLYGFYRGK
uniref:Fibronectin type-III domain-containing protein n=1 Tax=Romanomermis culicivorax TaxID=13658 RepID=A0A915K3H8_ROMCU